MTDHQYPHGAMQTLDDFLTHVAGQHVTGRPVAFYLVHNLGGGSFISEYQTTPSVKVDASYHGKTIPKFFGDGPILFCHNVRNMRFPESLQETAFALGDFNIGGHCNKHYLFYTKEDAEAYLEVSRNDMESDRIFRQNCAEDSFLDYEDYPYTYDLDD